ncbi:hypothetical protein ACFY1V_13175 [Streptomyces sp. NPDC001255]|uniref:hypothetical protein n=1 Tax=Streptomyces sp. NPDC001255 TaxID=3364550 RepID=UPI003675F60A
MTSVYTEFTQEAGSRGGPDAFRDYYVNKGRQEAIAVGAAMLAKMRAENVTALAKGRGQGLAAGALLTAGVAGAWTVTRMARRAVRTPIAAVAVLEGTARQESRAAAPEDTTEG